MQIFIYRWFPNLFMYGGGQRHASERTEPSYDVVLLQLRHFYPLVKYAAEQIKIYGNPFQKNCYVYLSDLILHGPFFFFFLLKICTRANKKKNHMKLDKKYGTININAKLKIYLLSIRHTLISFNEYSTVLDFFFIILKFTVIVSISLIWWFDCMPELSVQFECVFLQFEKP